MGELTPAALRALMVQAEWRPGMTTADVIDQAKAEAVLSGWRAWLPGLLGESWQPRIGERVTASEWFLREYGEWRDIPLFVVGVHKDRGIDGLNIWVSEHWPVDSNSDGYTDGFRIGRAGQPDDLYPSPIAPASQAGSSAPAAIPSPSPAGAQSTGDFS